mmetsp:Transcript_20131/g.55588  ORF Transcript_20131/g.55588 Transcript_20131/m.55588 type:complete len:85 (-) Transcript_20131:117-371(-)
MQCAMEATPKSSQVDSNVRDAWINKSSDSSPRADNIVVPAINQPNFCEEYSEKNRPNDHEAPVSTIMPSKDKMCNSNGDSANIE